MSKLLIFTDGGSRGNPGPAALGVTILNEKDETVHEIAKYIGTATNNEAEYNAVLASLTWLEEAGLASYSPTQITWKLDSKLVVEQLLKHWKIKEPRMAQLAQECWKILTKLDVPTSFVHVPREENRRADELVNQALDAQLK